MNDQKVKLKHNYTSELELKSLLIRIKNDRVNQGTQDRNSRINKYIRWHTAINNKKYESPTKRNLVKNRIKSEIVRLSELTSIDKQSYERFGEVILLMIKHILMKPNFSGYSYFDEFYSDSVYKILKYLHNFDHKKTSEITGNPVDAFAYISQYIHNSIIFIINKKKKDLNNLRNHISMEHVLNDENQSPLEWYVNDIHKEPKQEDLKEKTIFVSTVETSLVDVIKDLEQDIDEVDRLTVVYPKDYAISFDEYNSLKDLLKGKVSITRAKDE